MPGHRAGRFREACFHRAFANDEQIESGATSVVKCSYHSEEEREIFLRGKPADVEEAHDLARDIRVAVDRKEAVEICRDHRFHDDPLRRIPGGDEASRRHPAIDLNAPRAAQHPAPNHPEKAMRPMVGEPVRVISIRDQHADAQRLTEPPREEYAASPVEKSGVLCLNQADAS